MGLVLMGVAMLSKSLIQLSIDGQSCVPSLLFGLRPNYGRGNGGNVDLHQKDLCQYALTPRTVVVSDPDLVTGHYQPIPHQVKLLWAEF